MKGWINIKQMEPLDGQLIIPYHKDMEYEIWLQNGLVPIMRWDESKRMALDLDNDWLEITHWLPIPNEPQE